MAQSEPESNTNAFETTFFVLVFGPGFSASILGMGSVQHIGHLVAGDVGSIIMFAWAVLPALLIALGLYVGFIYLVNSIIGDSIFLRLVFMLLSFGIIGGLIDGFDFFGGEETEIADAAAGAEASGGESTAGAEATTAGSEETAMPSLNPEMEYVEGYVKEDGTEVEGYFRTVADGVESNNLSADGNET